MDRLAEAPSGAVLDLACGTGVVARVLRERFGPEAWITGVDISESMIAAARTLCQKLPGRFDWHAAPAHDMPLETASFGVCFCQQGIQYFPDERAALAEVRRVLADDGLLVVTVWSGPNAYFRAQSSALRRHVGEEAAERALAPFAYDGRRRLPGLLSGAGFADTKIGELVIERVISDAERGIEEDIAGSPLAPLVRARGQRTMRDVVGDILIECADFLDDGDLRVPQHALIAMARAE